MLLIKNLKWLHYAFSMLKMSSVGFGEGGGDKIEVLLYEPIQ